MKGKVFIAIWIVVIAVLSSCEDIGNLEDFQLDGLFEDFALGFNTDYYEFELPIPPAPAGLELTVVAPMQFDLNEELKINGYEGVSVSSIKVLDASLEVADESNISVLDPIDYIITAISANELPVQTIASGEIIESGTTVLPLETSDNELIDYLTDTEYSLSATGMLKETTSDTLWVKGRIRYRVSLLVESL